MLYRNKEIFKNLCWHCYQVYSELISCKNYGNNVWRVGILSNIIALHYEVKLDYSAK